MNDNINEIEENEYDYVNKSYMGIVIDANDPKKIGRAKIRVFGVYDDLDDDDIPWAFPKNKNTIFGKHGKGGSVSIPKMHSVLNIRFNNGNIYSPEFYSLEELADDVVDELEDSYEGSHVLLFDGDEEIKIWFSRKKGLTFEMKGSKMNIGNDKAITIDHADSTSTIELRGSEVNINSNSKINLTSNSEIEAASNDVWINGNFVKVGHGPVQQAAVLGDNLFLLLNQLASVIDAKYFVTPGVTTAIVNQYKNIVLSDTVQVSK